MPAFHPDGLGGKLKAGQNIFTRQIGKFFDYIFNAVPPGKILQQGFDWIAKPPHNRSAMAYIRINRYP